jgi:hypothetical protein
VRQYQCDVVIQSPEGESIVQEVGAFDAPNLPDAIKSIEAKLQLAPEVFRQAQAVRIRQRGKVVWLRVLGALGAIRP